MRGGDTLRASVESLKALERAQKREVRGGDTFKASVESLKALV